MSLSNSWDGFAKLKFVSILNWSYVFKLIFVWFFLVINNIPQNKELREKKINRLFKQISQTHLLSTKLSQISPVVTVIYKHSRTMIG